jgi:hypothetical protein
VLRGDQKLKGRGGLRLDKVGWKFGDFTCGAE